MVGDERVGDKRPGDVQGGDHLGKKAVLLVCYSCSFSIMHESSEEENVTIVACSKKQAFRVLRYWTSLVTLFWGHSHLLANKQINIWAWEGTLNTICNLIKIHSYGIINYRTATIRFHNLLRLILASGSSKRTSTKLNKIKIRLLSEKHHHSPYL